MTAALEAIPESIIDILLAEQALILAKRRVLWNIDKHLFLGPIHALRKEGCEPRFEEHTIYIRAAGDKHKLAAIMRILRCSGFTFDSPRPQKGDTEWNSHFHIEGATINIFFMFSSSVCKRVKVGTKMQEVDIYETQCDDIAPAIEAPAEGFVPIVEFSGEDSHFDEEIPF